MNYLNLKRAQEALNSENWPLAFRHFLICKRTAKISFNLAVLAIWQHFHHQIITNLLKESLRLDPFLAISAFYLGIFESSSEYFQVALKGFRKCQFIDYTQIGMPFVLEIEDVLFNLVSLQDSTADPTHLNSLSIQSITSLLLENTQKSKTSLRIPPYMNPKMIFNLLPSIRPERLALKGPEHVSFIEGEDENCSGFPDAQMRQLKFDILYKIDSDFD